MAKGRLSKTEKYLIEKMNSDGLKVDQISKELNRTEKTVKKYLDEIVVTENKKKKPQTHFINRTMLKNTKAVSIMTEAESSRKESVINRPKTNKYDRVIHKIHEDG